MIRLSDALISVILDNPRHANNMAQVIASETNPVRQELAVARYYRLELIGKGAPGNELQTALLNKAINQAAWPYIAVQLKERLPEMLKVEIYTEPPKPAVPMTGPKEKDDIICL